MKINFKTLSLVTLFLITFFESFGQCNVTETIIICSESPINNGITTIDFDTDGTPDGIINLYEEYFKITGQNLEAGIWSTTAGISITLEPDTGNVSIWNLRASTTDLSLNDYSFQLSNTSCGDVVAATINIVLEPFSGEALPPSGINNINLEVCEGSFDLFSSLSTASNIPPPHLNGVWSLTTSAPNADVIVQSGTDISSTNVTVDYQPGIPLVDQAILEFTYTVPGNSACKASQNTMVRVSVVRQVEAGTPNVVNICESQILNNEFDTDIDLRGDTYLINEDIEGQWLPDGQGEISDGNDSNINLRNIYNNLIINKGIRFGCETFEYTYEVEKRSGVCDNAEATVSITVHESLRPFKQKEGPNVQICANEIEPFSLFDQIEFTREGNIDFIYDNDFYVDWRLISGASSLGLVTQPNSVETFDSSINYSAGNLITRFATPGVYVFEYGVSHSILCMPQALCCPFPGNPNFCEPLSCKNESTEITIEILPFDYAGEDTTGVELCETIKSINLISQLESSPLAKKQIATTGIWTNSADEIIDNNYDFPEITEDTNFSFTYTTTHPISGCVDMSTLNFTILKELPNPAGNDTMADVCSVYTSIRLIDLLKGEPERTGFWTGPDGYVSSDFSGEFTFNDQMTPLQEAEYTYTVETTKTCIAGNTAILTIKFVEPIDIGSDLKTTYCKIQNSVDLLTELPNDIPKTGTFSEIDTVGALTGSLVSFASLTPGRYNFEYTVSDTGPCSDAKITIELTLLDEPTAGSAGDDKIFPICTNNYNINLFEILGRTGATPVTTGTWRGPLGYTSDNENAIFNSSDTNLIPLLDGGIYTYTVGGGICSTSFDTSTVTVEFVNTINIGNDIEQTFCLAENNVDLLSVLAPTVPKSGTFSEIDTTGALTGSLVSFGSLTPGNYNFEYTISDTGPCPDAKITIELTLLDESIANSAGINNEINFCTNDININLFTLLGDSASPTGTWTGPFGYSTTDNNAIFDSSNDTIIKLDNGTYTYTVTGNNCSTNETSASIIVTIIEPQFIGNDINITRCKSDGSINLFSLLNTTTSSTGNFIDIEDTKVLTEDGRVDFSALSQGIYNFQYSLTNDSPCKPSTLTIEIQIIDLEEPEQPNTTFCILDAKRLNDIEVNVTNFNWYSSFESEEPIIDNPILVNNTTLYLANVDAENCESERIEVPIKILNVGETTQIKDADGNTIETIKCPLDFQDGVTPNNDSQNDRFALVKEGVYNIPEAFPEFQLEIYNRFGTRVFEGNINTGEFKGESNVSLSIGNRLPSGVYFYVFNPNFKNNAPIQGSFYLSK